MWKGAKEAAAADNQLELLQAKSHTIMIPVARGTGKASGTICELLWAVNCAAINEGTGCTKGEMELVQGELKRILMIDLLLIMVH